MNTASCLAVRKARIRKKLQLSTKNEYREICRDNVFCENAEITEDFSSSNIVLRLSETENYSTDHTNVSLRRNLVHFGTKNKVFEPKNSEKNEIIIISDSSDEDHIFAKPESSRSATNNLKNIDTSVYISSSSDESDETEDFRLKYNESRKSTNQSNRAEKSVCNFEQSLRNFKTRQRCSILYTSDDTASTASSNKSKSSSSGKSNNSASISHVSPTPRSGGSSNSSNSITSIKDRKSISKLVTKPLNRLKDPSSAIGVGPSICSTKYHKVFPRKIMPRGPKLTKLEALKILKAVNSKRTNYFSPNSSDKSNKSQVSDTLKSGREIRKKNELKKLNIIAETDSEAEKSIVESIPEMPFHPKTLDNNVLETPTTNQDKGYNDLSSRKLKEITNWLLANPLDSKNDSSISHVSESNRNSLSSGNSSLERLERNYETPNNRHKFLKKNIDRETKMNDSDPKTPINSPDVLNGVTLVATNKRINIRTPQSETPATPYNNSKTTISTIKKRQTRIDVYLRKTKPNSGKYINEITPKPVNKTPAVVSKQLNPEDVRMADCVDILDKLYGDEWRAKADVILSEPRKAKVARKDRGVQTEKKVKPGAEGRLILVSDSEDEVEFSQFVSNIKPTLNSTRKIGPEGLQTSNSTRQTRRERTKKKDSFINDTSSSEGSGRSSYHTALTQAPVNDYNKKFLSTPVSTKTLRAMAICDPDTEEEIDNTAPKQKIRAKEPNRRKLSYSDEENNSSTSEFDPEDIVQPKTLPKTNGSKTPQQLFKSPNKTIRNLEAKSAPSFLSSLSACIPMYSVHLDARIFRQNFKDTKEALCKKLFALYNERVFEKKLPHDLLIEWSTRMRGTAGFCYNKKSIKTLGKISRSSRIVLATKVVDTPERLRDTLIHELCHAAAWVINEVSDGHGPFWKGWANKAIKAFPELPPIRRCHDYKINTKYTYKCTNCGYSIGRHSKSLDVQKKRCGYCYGKFELFINRTTKSGTVQMKTPSRSKDPSAFALYVKENYHSVKQNRRSMKHGDVMKVLGQEFSAMKIAKKQCNIIGEKEKNLSE